MPHDLDPIPTHLRPDIAVAKAFIRLQRPLPIDLTYRLLAAGVDVTELERRYSA